MTDIAETLSHIPAWAGSVPGWIMAVSFLGILWKGLPAVLDAWTNSVAKERDHREREIKRLEDQISAADDRHNECLEGQRSLRDEIERMRRAHTAEIGELHKIITGMTIQMRQIQITAAGMASDGGGLSPALVSMLDQLEKVGGKQ